MKIIVSTILFVFIGITAFSQKENIYAMPKKANPSFSLIDTANIFLQKQKKVNTIRWEDYDFTKNNTLKNEMPCKKDFVNVIAIPNTCKNGTKIFAAPIPNTFFVPGIK
jgi:hypothetical protein